MKKHVEPVGSGGEPYEESTETWIAMNLYMRKPGTVSTNEPNNTKCPLQGPTPNTASTATLAGIFSVSPLAAVLFHAYA
jgi:hypothetical protein